jgi:hypothetical protein
MIQVVKKINKKYLNKVTGLTMKLLLVFIFALIFLNVVRSADDFQKFDRVEHFFNDEPELLKMTTKDAQRQVKKEMRRRYKSPKIILRNIKGKGKMNTDHQYYTSALTGEKVMLENFTHNNMTPFFGGRLKQNMNVEVNDSKLEMFTGTSKNTCDKDSERCFSDVHNNINDQAPQYLSQFERMERPKVQNNVLPSEPVRVGPGYNKNDKFASSPSGGFQQNDMTHDAGLYKSVDDLRTKNNPKSTYNGMVIPGQKESKRAEQSKLRRNRVETFYEKDEEDLFKTTGAYTKEAMKPCIDVKNTARQETTVEYKGAVHDSTGSTQVKAEASGPTKKKSLSMFGVRNTNVPEGKKSDDDFGRKSILVYQNGRDVTSTKTREGSITTMIKSLITPIQDFMKPTQKQYMVHNARAFAGNVNGPNKLTIYDPNGVARTTIKETTIHDATTGNMRVNSTSIVYDPSDVAKTTLKETMKNYSNDINLKGASKPRVHDSNDKTRTTMRQTTENAERDGNFSTVQHGSDGYRNATFNAKSTGKELVSDNDYYGMPETENGDAYQTTKFEAKQTQKHMLSDKEYTGNGMKDVVEPVSYESIYNATINDLKEDTLVERVPTTTSTKMSSGMESVQLTKEKSECNSKSHRSTQNYEKLMTSLPPAKELINIIPVDRAVESDRLDTTVLKSLKSNPYVIR